MDFANISPTGLIILSLLSLDAFILKLAINTNNLQNNLFMPIIIIEFDD